VLRARGLEVVRGDRTLLRDVSLSLAAGEIVGVLGPSGAGKSTLFGALIGDPPADSGVVHLGEDDVTRWPMWRRARAHKALGYVPQSPSVLWQLTTRDNLATFAKVCGVELDVRAVAGRVGLTERLDVRAGDLSAGERRRLEVARAACIRRPAVLLCDEPFAGVDPLGAARLGELLRELASEGVAIVLADHHVDEALALCDRACLLLGGQIALEATPEEFRRDPLVQKRYLGNAELDR
jgi:lipopolysaccharide export system ATP-binding protein